MFNIYVDVMIETQSLSIQIFQTSIDNGGISNVKDIFRHSISIDTHYLLVWSISFRSTLQILNIFNNKTYSAQKILQQSYSCAIATANRFRGKIISRFPPLKYTFLEAWLEEQTTKSRPKKQQQQYLHYSPDRMIVKNLARKKRNTTGNISYFFKLVLLK